MEASEELDNLRRRMRREGAGSLTEFSDQTMTATFTRLRNMARWLQTKVEEYPLICLLLAMQVGFVAGHWGPRRAKH